MFGLCVLNKLRLLNQYKKIQNIKLNIKHNQNRHFKVQYIYVKLKILIFIFQFSWYN